jgi:predicted ATPase
MAVMKHAPLRLVNTAIPLLERVQPQEPAFRQQVHDALAHLYDPVYLQTHPLARHLAAAESRISLAQAGKDLRQRLLDAISLLHPGFEARGGKTGGRGHQVLQLRYVEALEPPVVQERLGISKSQYYREHNRAVDALVSSLAAQWEIGSGTWRANGAPRDASLGMDGDIQVPEAIRAMHLPRPLSSFLGRERELAEIDRLLARNRLLTLVGPPGTGKTRLATELASRLGGRFTQGVCLVALAPVHDASLVPEAVAQTLGVPESGGPPALERLKVYLSEQHFLLVLDNFEHVLEAAPVVLDLLMACPEARILVTSRAALRVSGEQEFPVPPLALPELAPLPAVECLTHYSAVQLFVERAQLVKPDFALSKENAADVVEICHRLDGLPLAIELAAVRIRLLPPAAMNARLAAQRLALLSNGTRDVPERHRTLRQAIAWSYDLLEPEEQSLFRALSVFSGGCALGAIEVVAGADDTWAATKQGRDTGVYSVAILNRIESLQTKSLLRQEIPSDGEPRLVLLETVQEYAREQALQKGELDALRTRHATFYLEWLEAQQDPPDPSAEAHRRSQDPHDLRRLEHEHGNLHQALNWWAQRARHGDSDAAMAAERAMLMCGAMGLYWQSRSRVDTWRRWIEGLLALPAAAAMTEARARAHRTAGRLARAEPDYDAAGQHFWAALAIRRALGDRLGVADCLWPAALDIEDVVQQRAMLEESLTIFREYGDRAGEAIVLQWLGEVQRESDPETARSLIEESIRLHREMERSTASGLRRLGMVALFQGDYDTAGQALSESLALNRAHRREDEVGDTLRYLGLLASKMGDYVTARAHLTESLALAQKAKKNGGIVRSLEVLAAVEAAQQRLPEAMRLAGVAGRLRETITARSPSDRMMMVHHEVEHARQLLGEPMATAALEEGRAMTMDQAIVDATREPPSDYNLAREKGE